MGFYKTTQKAALDAWDNEINQRIALREKADVFAKKFGGKPVLCAGPTDYRFYGLRFDAAPLIGHSSLWTLSRAQNQFTREPRGKHVFPVNAAKSICSCWMRGMMAARRNGSHGNPTGRR